jgi:cytochrome c oxidase assembly protein subunit 15
MKVRPDKNILRFRRLGVTSIVAVYLLIFVGGVVRSSGSGMGCPDWPKCFGEWVPPTAESQLPDDYKDVYSTKRKEKNEKLAKMLTSLGADKSANKILGDDNTYVEADFNATKTWVEYVNRLIGALIGLILFALFLSAIPLIPVQKSLAAFSGLIVVVTGFQGWLGSIVVSTNLLPGMITVHMLLALVIISFLIILVFNSYKDFRLEAKNTEFRKLKPILLLLLIALIPQIVLGTDVREHVDVLAKTYGFDNRESWISEMGISFYIHRSLSWLFMAASGWVFFKLFKSYSKNSLEFRLGLGLLSLVSMEILFGVGMYFFDIPPYIQPLHLLAGTLLFGFVLFMFLMSARAPKKIVG